ncbi:MAG: YraN family protein [Croceimicrobium sp.]|nr:YraN family protein [Bacteroidota bacterium]
MKNHNLGQDGENVAARYLLSQGYALLEQNWRFQKKEIDLIASDGEELVIVEVKTRQTNRFGEAWQFVNRSKQSYLIYAANAYAQSIKWPGMVRFDIIGICHQPYRLEHIKDAFYPTL